MTLRRLFLIPLLFAVACSGSDDDDSGPQYELPQILPNPSPICVSYANVNVGDMHAQTVLMTNEGRMPLLITSGEVTDDMDMQFSFDEVRTSLGGGSCSDAAPCSLEFDEQAVVRFFYNPTTSGWHTANLLIESNAQNFPSLRTFILAKAAPMGEDPKTWDAGPKPASAMEGTLTESCRQQDAP